MHWLYLFGAIVCEVIATSVLKATDGFSRPLPTIVVLVGYGAAFYGLSMALRGIPVGVAYALWAGIGIVAITAVGLVVYRETLDSAAAIGIALILIGALVIKLFSRTAQF